MLDLLARFGGLDLGENRRTTPIWGAILPTDRDALATLGVEDPEHELGLIEEEDGRRQTDRRTGE